MPHPHRPGGQGACGWGEGERARGAQVLVRRRQMGEGVGQGRWPHGPSGRVAVSGPDSLGCWVMDSWLTLIQMVFVPHST